MAKKVVPIKYTSRDFATIKEDLVDYARRYYPDSFKDFNEASFGALMLDTVAYVGDLLSFYVDYQANESFLETAIEYDNVVKIGRQLGYKFTDTSSAHGIVTLYVLVPAATTGLGPDSNYIPMLERGSTFSSIDGSSYILVDSVDFSDPDNEIVVAAVDSDEGTPTSYAIRSYGQVVSGQIVRDTIEVGSYKRFFRKQLAGTNITEVLTVVDSDGHKYYEVDHLSQNVIYRSVVNRQTNRDTVKEILKPVSVPRRFTVERERGKTFLQFGYGSENNLKANVIIDPSNIALQFHGKEYITDVSFDPSKIIQSDKFGVAPANTKLTVIYRINSDNDANAAAGTISSARSTIFNFPATLEGLVLSETTKNTVMSSLEVVNDAPIIGDVSLPTSEEVKTRIFDTFATQKRAVTGQDYVSMIYNMPGKFGAVKRARIVQDQNSLKRNLNLYVISENKNGNLIETNSTIKSNLKTWIKEYKMINDTVDILDAKIVNIGINFTAIANPKVNKFSVLQQSVNILIQELSSLHREIGESFTLSDVYTALRFVPGIVDVVDVEIVQKTGGLYSTTGFNIEDQMSPDGRVLYAPQNVILEIKFPKDDIKGTFK
tara:strand:+ start:2488 stop:4293 length:1806 start_codon:yes stop_codon:yes gene_type:complete